MPQQIARKKERLIVQNRENLIAIKKQDLQRKIVVRKEPILLQRDAKNRRRQVVIKKAILLMASVHPKDLTIVQNLKHLSSQGSAVQIAKNLAVHKSLIMI